MPDDRRLVYSSDGSLPLPETRERKPTKNAAGKAPPLPDDGVIRVGCERRRGGSLTIVYGLDSRELVAVAADLKKRCGVGGSSKDGVVTLQGDKRDAAIAYFTERGRRTKKMGGT